MRVKQLQITQYSCKACGNYGFTAQRDHANNCPSCGSPDLKIIDNEIVSYATDLNQYKISK